MNCRANEIEYVVSLLRIEVRVKGGMSVTEWHISVLFGLNGDLVGHTCMSFQERKIICSPGESYFNFTSSLVSESIR